MINIEETLMVPLTRPAGAGHPLPLGEGFARNIFLTWATKVCDRFYWIPAFAFTSFTRIIIANSPPCFSMIIVGAFSPLKS